LEKAAAALGLSEEKDMAGHKLMMKLTKPRKPTKADPDSKWHQKREDLERVFDYCKQDVLVEALLSEQLRELPPQELELWQLDQEMNYGGIRCDRELAESALRIADEARAAASEELDILTGGQVTKTTARPSFVAWLNAAGCETESTAADTIDELLTQDLDPTIERALTIWRRSNKTSTKKYQAILNRMGADDDRVRDTVMYWGASTGRWSGRGIQPHNFPRGHGRAWTHRACLDILTYHFEELKLLYGEDGVLDMLADALRGAIVPTPGHEFVVADYSAIEARGTFWISGHKNGLAVFEAYDRGEGPDIYCWQAEQIFNETISKKDPRRQGGKVVILGCGYQMGWEKLITYAAGMKVQLGGEEAKRLVDAYRDTNWPVVEFWKDINASAMEAVRRRGRGGAVRHGRLAWQVLGRFLHCRLPNGRLLSYLDPKIELVKAPWGDHLPALTFMGVNTYTHQWTRCSTYGGKLTENVVQALCRDIMAEAMLRLRGTEYRPVLTVHDEIVSEVVAGEGDVKEFQGIMAAQPEWADGFPIEADGWRDVRFHK
jgi:DNA polymerase